MGTSFLNISTFDEIATVILTREIYRMIKDEYPLLLIGMPMTRIRSLGRGALALYIYITQRYYFSPESIDQETLLLDYPILEDTLGRGREQIRRDLVNLKKTGLIDRIYRPHRVCVKLLDQNLEMEQV